MKKVAIVIILVLATIFALYGLNMIVSGSLMLMPPEDQIDNTRIAGGVLLGLGIVINGIVVTMLTKRK